MQRASRLIKVVEISDHVEEKRRGINQAVDAIQDAAVAGNRGSHVLDAQVALDEADGQVAQLSTDAHDQPSQQQIARVEVRKCEMEQPGKQQGYYQCPERPLPCLLGADLAAQWPSAEQLAGGK